MKSIKPLRSQLKAQDMASQFPIMGILVTVGGKDHTFAAEVEDLLVLIITGMVVHIQVMTVPIATKDTIVSQKVTVVASLGIIATELVVTVVEAYSMISIMDFVKEAGSTTLGTKTVKLIVNHKIMMVVEL